MELTTVWFVLIAVLWIGYLVLEGFEQGLAERAPQRHAGDHHLGLLEHPELEFLGPSLRSCVVEQVVRELTEQAVQREPGVVLRVLERLGIGFSS